MTTITLTKTPAEMTSQEIFDHVASHLFEQGKRSFDVDSGTCMYRAPEGLSCAAGCLIPDKLYHPTMEYRNILSVMDRHPHLETQIGKEHGMLLRRLQLVHDNEGNWSNTSDMQSALRYEALPGRLSMAHVLTLRFKDR